MIDLAGEYGARVERRLKDEEVIWLTTTGSDLTPQPRPVWFYWNGEEFLIFSRPEAHKLQHIERHPNVALHFNSDERGHDVVVFLGRARVDREGPSSGETARYIRKYRGGLERLESTPEELVGELSVSIYVEPYRLRGS